MPAPTTADELLDLLQKSNLVDEARLKSHIQKLRDTGTFPADPNRLAQLLVRDALLTYFQAEQLLQGKYKRFSLGKYKVLEKLGSGGMGTVFLCEHKLMRRRVAVKVLPVPKAEDKASLDRFYREARAIAAVDHPNIVRAYDLDQDDNLHFLVMEWVDGTNLQDLVKKFGPLDIIRSCHYIYGAAVGLQHAHEIGLIHRDIKPGNILLDRSGVVKILDLGLARLTHDTDDNLTRQNDENVLGTADYLAPEQALDSHLVDIRADIYSLGATFYYLLTGSAPFPEGSVAQKLIWHQNRAPRPIKSLRSEVPDELLAVVEKMMAKERDNRYQSPSEVMAALAPWVSSPIPPPADREMPTLSPAVAGGQTGTRPMNTAPAITSPVSLPGGSVRTVPSSGPTTMSGMPTTVATTATITTTSEPSPAVWSTLDTDTQSVARGDTEKPEPFGEPIPEEEDRPSRVARRTQRSKGKVLIFAAVGATVLAVAAIGTYFAFFNKKTDPGGGGPTGGTTTRKIIVSKTPGENTTPTLREALIKATAGDTIVIADSRIVEPPIRLDRHKHKDVTIESGTPDGKPAVIEFLGIKGGVMLSGSDVDGFRLRNLEFDGKGAAEIGIQIGGTMPGAVIEGVTVRGVQKTGVHLWNISGAGDRPVVLDRVRVVLTPTSEAGIVFLAQGVLDNKFVAVRNCRFEGPGRAGIRFDGTALDVEMTNNRFFKLNAAVSFARPGGRVRFANNTVFQSSVGLLFDVPAPPPKTPANPINYDIKVAFNYFANTAELVKCPVPVAGLAGEHNFFGPGSAPGSPSIAATPLPAPALPNPNPEDDATFLRFPATGFPTAGPNKARVGAQ